MNNQSVSGHKKREKGSVVIEAMLWIGFFVFLIPVLTDTFILANTYLSMNQIAREAIVTEISFPTSLVEQNVSYDLPNSDIMSLTREQEEIELNNCTVGSVYRNKLNFTPICAHNFIKWRVRRLIESHKVKILPENVSLRTTLDSDDIMSISIESTYDSFTYFFEGLRLNNRVSARYIGNS